MADDKPNYTKPTSQLDLEARQSEDYVPPTVLGRDVDPQKSENGYVGVDPIYQNFANDTEAPYAAEEGPESVVEENYYHDEVDFNLAATPEGSGDAEDKVERLNEEPVTPSGATVSTEQDGNKQVSEGTPGSTVSEDDAKAATEEKKAAAKKTAAPKSTTPQS